MLNASLQKLAKLAEDTQLEAKFFFPDSSEKQLRWCAVKGALRFATEMAHFLRTAKDQDDNPVFPIDRSETDFLQPAATGIEEGIRILYHSQELLLESVRQYDHLLKSRHSIHDLIEHINSMPTDGGNQEAMQKCRGMTPPWTSGNSIIVRTMDFSNVTRFARLAPGKLRIGNLVDVPHGSSFMTVRINGITRRKIGYARTDGSGERYVRLHDVSPVPVNDESLQEIGFKCTDEYLFDGKNYYDNVYQEKLVDSKGDLWHLEKFKKASVRKYEYFIENKFRFFAYIITDTVNKNDYYVQLEAKSFQGYFLHVYYPMHIHQIQNFIDFLDDIALSCAQVSLERKRKVAPTDYD